MTDSEIKYVGVDGCKAGWIGVGLSDSGCWDVKVCVDFPDLLTHFGDACVVLVDMPIGLPEDEKPILRACDKQAQDLLGDRKQSVFHVPSRRFVDEVVNNPCWEHHKANKWSKARYDCAGISVQAFSITRKIGEVDRALASDKGDSSKVREAHPEVCFWALNGNQPMSKNKGGRAGYDERLATLRGCAHDVDSIDVESIANEIRCKYTKGQVADDDILDALALAITAKLGSQEGNELKTLPKNPQPGSVGEMVYALHKDKTTQC